MVREEIHHNSIRKQQKIMFTLLFTLFTIIQVGLGANSCGTSCTWSYANGVLTFTGSGAIKDYNYTVKPEWNKHSNEATEIVISEGITEIGKYAFQVLPKVHTVHLPKSLSVINEEVFTELESLLTIDLNSGSTSFVIYEGVLFNYDKTALFR